MKAVLLGDAGVGKTSIAQFFTTGKAPQFPDSTIGAAFSRRHVEVDGEIVRVELWDTAGQEKYRALAPMYYRGAAIAFIVHDVRRPETLKNALAWVSKVQAQPYGQTPATIVLMGNKCDTDADDLKHMAVDFREAHALGCNACVPVSAIAGKGLDAAFFEAVRAVMKAQPLQQSAGDIIPLGEGGGGRWACCSGSM